RTAPVPGHSVHRRRDRGRLGRRDTRLPGVATAVLAHRELTGPQVLLLTAPHGGRPLCLLLGRLEVAAVSTPPPLAVVSHGRSLLSHASRQPATCRSTPTLRRRVGRRKGRPASGAIGLPGGWQVGRC